MESQSSNPIRKPIRRRSQTRKMSKGCIINMADARKEIAHALQLHRSSSSSSSTSSTNTTTSTPSREVLGDVPYNYRSTAGTTLIATSSYGSYSLPIPIAEPVWSTTAPWVPAAPPSTTAAGLEALEFELEWGEENESSSYTWWFAFLGALDGKTIEKPKHHHFVEDNNVISTNSKIGKEKGSTKHGEVDSFVGPSDQNVGSLDEWLMFPVTEDGSDENRL